MIKPRNPVIFYAIKQNLPIIFEDEIINEILQRYQIIISSRQPKILKRLWTRANFMNLYDNLKLTKRNRPKYGICDRLTTDTEYLFSSGKTFKVKACMSCDVKNLIYVIKCCGCQGEYIGETGDTLHHRATVYKQQIRDVSFYYFRCYLLFLCGLFYEAICCMSFRMSFCSCVF